MVNRGLSVLLLLVAIALPVSLQPRKRQVLAIGDVHRKVYQHDAVSHALATIERLGYESGLYDTYIRTDIQLLTKHPIRFAETRLRHAPLPGTSSTGSSCRCERRAPRPRASTPSPNRGLS